MQYNQNWKKIGLINFSFGLIDFWWKEKSCITRAVGLIDFQWGLNGLKILYVETQPDNNTK